MSKARAGNFFEDFTVGKILHHATPRTVTAGDVALYLSLYGSRFAVQSSDTFAKALGFPGAPVDDLLFFHIVFGKTVPDISLNAVANLGYAECRFLAAVYPGDTLTACSEVIGVRETSKGDSGVVYVRTAGSNQHGETVLTYVRWVMVRKRDPNRPAPAPVVPDLADCVPPETLGSAVPPLNKTAYDFGLAGAVDTWSAFKPGERVDHMDGMTIEDAEHQMATRLYQNTARVHFNQHAQKNDRFGRRLIYGGHIISLARALSFNGLANAFHITAINGGRHVAPCFAGETVYCWSEIRDCAEIPGRDDVGALRVNTIATKDLPCTNHPGKTADGYADGVVLDLDYWVLLPK
ncbi:MAG: MaoC family dehydratase [Methyloligellaceae bacterium]